MKIIGFIVWLIVWWAGCAIFDSWLQLHGSWLMMGGVVTFMACEKAVACLEDE